MSSKPKTKVTINNGNNSNAGGRVNNNLKVQNIQTVKDDCLTSQSLDKFLSFIRNIESLYRMAVAEEQETDDTTQDIMHCLEFEEHTYHEFAQLSKELAEIRKQRRMAKDTIAVLKPVLDWADKNTAVIRELEGLLGVVRKNEQKLNNRLYTPKTNNVELFTAKTSGTGNKSNNTKGDKN